MPFYYRYLASFEKEEEFIKLMEKSVDEHFNSFGT